ncbi:MAG: DNA polymerase III subunit delta [Bacteroidales bacterium]|nr:DNA polymerase III subunit delta [Bacteroidales bacterium]
MQFKDIIGQDEVKNNLRNMYETHRIPHAMMFVGREGTGALPLAVAYAQYINCTGDKSGGDSCGKCPSCIKYQKIAHPDLHMIYPNVNRDTSTDSLTYISEWREALTTNPYLTIAEWTNLMDGTKRASIRDNDATLVHQKLRMKPLEAQYQILIVWYPETMNDAFANKILKILEEPPTDTMFMLVAEKVSLLLPTIVSRTQIINVPPIVPDDMVAHLKQKYGVAPDEAMRVARIANGNAKKASYMVEDAEELNKNLDFFVRMMRMCYARRVHEMAPLCDETMKMSSDELNGKLSYALHMIRESFVMNLNHQELNYMSVGEEQFSQKFCRFVHIDNAIKISDVINKAIAKIEQNGNHRIVMMDLLLNVAMYLHKPRS